MKRLVTLCCLSLAGLAACAHKTDPERPYEAVAGYGYFMQYVKPVLETHCLACHRGSHPPAGLSLVQRSGVYAPRRHGRAFVVPGNPNASRLLTAVAEGGSHPGASPMLSAAEVDILYEWIEDGAYWPDNPSGFLLPWEFVPPRKKGLLAH